MAATKTNEVYVLFLDTPVCGIPVGVYKTPQEAVNAAADLGLPRTVEELENYSGGQFETLTYRIAESSYAFNDLGRKANRKINGYSVEKFVDGAPAGHDTISPYTHNDLVIPDETNENEGDEAIDRDQELVF